MIASPSNAQVKQVCALCKKSRYRKETGLFVVEGPKMAAELGRDEGSTQDGTDVLRNLAALPCLGQRTDGGKMMMEIMYSFCVV